MVAPTWRSAEISAEPEPLRSGERADRAAFIVCGMASPRPSPKKVSQAAANPVPLAVLVVAPTPRVTAMIAKPMVTSGFALASGGRTEPSAALRGEANRVLQIIPTTSPPIIGSSRSPLPMAFAPCTPGSTAASHRRCRTVANETSVASVVPQVKPADRNSRARSAAGRPDGPHGAGQPALPGHEHAEDRGPGNDGGQRRAVASSRPGRPG